MVPSLFQRADFQPSPDLPSDVARPSVIPEEEEEEECEQRALLPRDESGIDEEEGADLDDEGGSRL